MVRIESYIDAVIEDLKYTLSVLTDFGAEEERINRIQGFLDIFNSMLWYLFLRLCIWLLIILVISCLFRLLNVIILSILFNRAILNVSFNSLIHLFWLGINPISFVSVPFLCCSLYYWNAWGAGSRFIKSVRLPFASASFIIPRFLPKTQAADRYKTYFSSGQKVRVHTSRRLQRRNYTILDTVRSCFIVLTHNGQSRKCECGCETDHALF